MTKGNVHRVRSDIGSSPIGATGTADVLTWHDDFGNVASVMDPNEHLTLFDYSSSPFKLYPSVIRAPDTAGVMHVTGRETDLLFGKPTALEDENGEVTQIRYDSLGRVVCEAGPGDDCDGSDATVLYVYHYGNPEAMTYQGKLSSVEVKRIDPDANLGFTWTQSYSDALGRPRFQLTQQVVDSTLSTVVRGQTRYDAQGRVSHAYAPYASTLEIVESPVAPATTYAYLLNGQASVQDPLGRIHSAAAPNGETTRTYYEGSRTRVVDPRGDESWSMHDAFGREVRREHRAGAGATLMSYAFERDGLGRVTSTTISDDPATTVTETYDLLGRVIARVDPDSGNPGPQDPEPGTWVFGYDKAGNLIYQDDPKAGQHVQMCYDALDRIERRCSFVGDSYVVDACENACASGSTESSYTYDEPSGGVSIGRLTSVSDQSGGESFVYDERGRVIESTKTIQGRSVTTEFGFTEGDKPLWVRYPDGEVVANTFGAVGQIDGVVEYGGASTIYVSEITYDVFGRVKQLVHGNGVVDRREYFDGSAQNFRLHRIRAGKASTTEHMDLEYGYNALGKVSGIQDYRYLATLSNTATFGYDALGRLETASGVAYSETFSHDPLGNLTRTSGVPISYSPDKPHQVALRDGQFAVTYDANGNLTHKQTPGDSLINVFDPFGRLTSSSFAVSGSAQSQQYDYTGRRVLRASGGITERYFSALVDFDGQNFTKYYYAGSQLVAARWLYDPAFGTADAAPLRTAPPQIPPELPVALGAATLLLLLGLGSRERRLGVGIGASRALGASLLVLAATPPVGLLSVSSARADCDESLDLSLYHYHGDHLGSTQVLTDRVGAAYAHIRYTPYGEVRGRWDGNGVPIAPEPAGLTREFTGYESDSVTGLHYAGARFYDPELGQFLSHDPALQFASPYAYGAGDPLNGTDPNGATFLGLEFAIAVGFAAWLALSVAVTGFDSSGHYNFDALKAAAIGFGITVASAYVLGPVAAGLKSSGHAEIAFAVRAAGVGYSGYSTVSAAQRGDVPGAVLAGFNTVVAAHSLADGMTTSGQTGKASQRDPALELAKEQLNKYNPPSVEFDREYQGFIFERANGELGTTPGLETQCLGAVCGGTYNDALDLIPDGAAPIYHWHTHGRAPETNPMAYGLFSQGDIEVINELGNINSLFRGGVVGTPSGRAYLLRPNVVPASPYDPPAVYRAQEYLGRIRR